MPRGARALGDPDRFQPADPPIGEGTILAEASPRGKRGPSSLPGMSETPPPPGPHSPIPSPPQDDGPDAPSGVFAKFLAVVEWLGNLLPHPVTLFALFALGIVLISGIAVASGLEVTDPRDETKTIVAKSLMSGEGFRWMTTNLVRNFTGFVPLGTVLVALLGVGVAEKSGLLSATIRGMILAAPPKLVTMVIVFAGVVSNTASEMGYVVIIPLAATIFHSLGRHPLAGLAAAFAGVSGGYSANILIGTVDPLLAGITQEAARYVDPTAEVHAAVNWYFMMTSTVMITLVGTFVTTKIVEPRLGRWDPNRAESHVERNPSMDRLRPEEKRGLRRAGVAAFLTCLLFAHVAGARISDNYVVSSDVSLTALADMSVDQRTLALTAAESLDSTQTHKLSLAREGGFAGTLNTFVGAIPAHGILRNQDTGGLAPSPFLKSVVVMIFVFFVVPGIVYGISTGTITGERDVIDAMADAMSSMGLYIVLVFFAAQFVKFFEWTELGQILAVVGADTLKSIGLEGPLVFLPFILMCCFVNLMLGSASAQWAVTAPIFVPMLMTLGYSPEVIQAAYRIGDSTTNIITPMMSYFGLILAFAARYDRKLGIGTLVSTMLPYTICFLLCWIVLFYLYVFGLDLPVGPGVGPAWVDPATLGTGG